MKSGASKKCENLWENNVLPNILLGREVSLLKGPDTTFIRKGSVFAYRAGHYIYKKGSVFANRVGHYIY